MWYVYKCEILALEKYYVAARKYPISTRRKWSGPSQDHVGKPAGLRHHFDCSRQREDNSNLEIHLKEFYSCVILLSLLDSVLQIVNQFHIDGVVSCNYNFVRFYCRASLFRRSIICVTYFQWVSLVCNGVGGKPPLPGITNGTDRTVLFQTRSIHRR